MCVLAMSSSRIAISVDADGVVAGSAQPDHADKSGAASQRAQIGHDIAILIIHGAQLAPRERTYCSKRCGEYDAMANEA